jgi:hypothetical protein
MNEHKTTAILHCQLLTLIIMDKCNGTVTCVLPCHLLCHAIVLTCDTWIPSLGTNNGWIRELDYILLAIAIFCWSIQSALQANFRFPIWVLESIFPGWRATNNVIHHPKLYQYVARSISRIFYLIARYFREKKRRKKKGIEN